MASVPFTQALRAEYQALFDSCQIKAAKASEVERLSSRLLANRLRYAAVADPLGIPWQLLGVIHNMECSQNFAQHLHNGDPLNSRTSHVPKGRPLAGEPPFDWEESAADALTMKRLPEWDDWSIPGILYCLERYNGWGPCRPNAAPQACCGASRKRVSSTPNPTSRTPSSRRSSRGRRHCSPMHPAR